MARAASAATASARPTTVAGHQRVIWLAAGRIAPSFSAMHGVGQRAEVLVGHVAGCVDEEGLGRTRDSELDRHPPIGIRHVRVPGVAEPGKEALRRSRDRPGTGCRRRPRRRNRGGKRVREHGMLVDAGRNAPAGPEVHDVGPAGEVAAAERLPVEGGERPLGCRPPDERERRSGAGRGRIPTAAATSAEPRSRHQQPARAPHLRRPRPWRLPARDGSRPPRRRATGARARSRIAAPSPTMAPPIQIQTTSGLRKRCRVTAPVAASEASRVTYRSSASEVRTAGVAIAACEFG